MRLIVPTLLAAMAASLAAGAAEAQSRKPLRLTVTPRSYLDPGKVVPVGSLQNYATFDRYTTPSYVYSGSARAEYKLPPRIGAGKNPFGPIDFGGGL